MVCVRLVNARFFTIYSPSKKNLTNFCLKIFSLKPTTPFKEMGIVYQQKPVKMKKKKVVYNFMFSINITIKSADSTLIMRFFRVLKKLIDLKLKTFIFMEKPKLLKSNLCYFKTIFFFLPQKKKRYTVIRSPFIYKKSQEAFEKNIFVGVIKVDFFFQLTPFFFKSFQNFFSYLQNLLPSSISMDLKFKKKKNFSLS